MIVEAADSLDAPTDIVADALEWVRSHRVLAYLVVAFFVIGWAVRMANDVIALLRNLGLPIEF